MRSLIVTITAMLAFFTPAVAGEVRIELDKARYYDVDQEIGGIIVSNPAIADVVVHSSRRLVLFGKMPGATSIHLFDKQGNRMLVKDLRVVNQTSGTVTVFSGKERMTLSCATTCEPTYTIGDGIDGIRTQGKDVGAQAVERFEMASTTSGGVAETSMVETSSTMPDPENAEQPGS